MSNGSTHALARIDAQLDKFANDPIWQRLWLNLESQSWRSLAVIPVGDATSIDVVHALAAVAWHQRGAPVIVADLRSIALPALAAARTELRRRIEHGERVLIGMNSLDVSPTSATLSRDADKAVLCVILGRTTRRHLRNAIRELGSQRCLGSILIRTKGY